MRAPEFWNHRSGRESAPALRALLAPAGWIYHGLRRRRMRSVQPIAIAVPVLCVGGATLGGAGKTPVLRALNALLRAKGVPVASIARGFGGRARGVIAVDAGRHPAALVGDEALLLAADGPHFIGRDRVAAARAAEAAGAAIVTMDDGFQNPSLVKTLSLLVVDADTGFGSGRLFPAGPLRESLAEAFARADAIVLRGRAESPPDDDLADALARFTKPIFHAQAEFPPAEPQARLASGARIYAFAGLARPERFYDSLKRLGFEIVDFAAFGDHHPYSAGELGELARAAERAKAELLTTEKDWVRLSPEWRARIGFQPLGLRFLEAARFEAFLAPILAPVLIKAAGGEAP